MTDKNKKLAIAENYLGEVYAKLNVNRSIGTVKVATNDEVFNFIYTLEYDKEVYDEEEGTYVTYDVTYNKEDRTNEELNRLEIALGCCYEKSVIESMIVDALHAAIKYYDFEDECWKPVAKRESVGKFYIKKASDFEDENNVDVLVYVENEYED